MSTGKEGKERTGYPSRDDIAPPGYCGRWGPKGPDAFKRLWSLLFDRLTRVHHLNNLIWVDTGTARFNWNPPADQFDVIGVDHYPKDPSDPASALWDALQARCGDAKLLAMSEVGGVPDVQAMARPGVHWAYFNSWTVKLGPQALNDNRLKALYLNP
jgi:mannan endo-1,4-beta-mannosidase